MDNGGAMEIDFDDPGPENSQNVMINLGSLSINENLISENSSASVQSLPVGDIEEVLENDRRYANMFYFLPNDEAEEIRASIVHQIFLNVLSGHLTFHRIGTDATRILDIGAGTGDWAVAMAESYPDSEIIATDIWPFQSPDMPPNLTYEIDDAGGEWGFAQKFDLIHIRGMIGAFKDWSVIYQQACQACSETGYIEIADLSLVKYTENKTGTALEEYNKVVREAANAAGVSLDLEHLEDQSIQDEGFRVLRRASVEVPVGTWHPSPSRMSMGKLALVAVLEGLEAQCLRLLTTYLGWSIEETKTLCEQVAEEIMEADLKPVMTCQIVIARKIITER